MLQRYETEMEYTERLHQLRPAMIIAFQPYADEGLSDEKMVKSFEAKIGSKSDAYASVKSRVFHSAQEYREAWFRGLLDHGESEVRCMLRNNILREYAILFIERSFVKDTKKYSRLKLNNCDREIYLGDNQNVIGVFIAPEFAEYSGKGWQSDSFKGLKTSYDYLTLGQIKKEGYLKGNIKKENEYNAELVKVNSFVDIEQFYSNFMHSGSPFEKEFINCYLNYVRQQKEWKSVPMLLPEVRWNKKSVYHKYRADYLIINYFTGRRLAIELSPDSTHLVGDDVKAEWIKENDKRNSYFFEYNVPTVTFTNAYLKNIQGCFDMIKDILIIPENKVQKFEEVIKLL